MGESGSGKTTLLNVLGGRASYGLVEGPLTFNGQPFDPAKINLGYVVRALQATAPRPAATPAGMATRAA